MQLNLSEVNWRVLILIQVILPGFPVLCLLVCDHTNIGRIAFCEFVSDKLTNSQSISLSSIVTNLSIHLNQMKK